MPTIEERLQALEDKEGVLRTLHDYAHMLDYGRDGDAFADLWVEDGLWKGTSVTTTAGSGSTRIEGRKELRDWFENRSWRSVEKPWEAIAHRRGHPTISVVDIRVEGDRATAECYFTGVGETANGPIISNIGRYLDVLVRCPDGRWRFQVRHLERTCTTFKASHVMLSRGPKEFEAEKAQYLQEVAAAAAKRRG